MGMKKIIFLSCVFIPLVSEASYSIHDYVREVKAQNSEFHSNTAFKKTAELQLAESKILTSLNAFSLAQIGSDKKEPQFPDFEGTNKVSRELQLGVEQTTSFGLSHKVYGSYNYLKQENATLIPKAEISYSALTYEFSLPLLKNAWGKGIDIQREGLEGRSKATSFGKSFEQRKILRNAHVAYWRLKMAQEVIHSQEEMIRQGENFLAWTKRRYRDRLADESDLKQAEAILDLRRFYLETEKTELLLAKQNFNNLREVPVDSEIPRLTSFPKDSELPRLPTVAEALKRPDILALEEQLKAESAEVKMAAENVRPELNIIASASLTGMSQNTDLAYGKAFEGKWPTYGVGVKLSVPLDRGSVQDISKAAVMRQKGVEHALKRNKFESVAGLEQLRLTYEQFLKQLKLTRILESAQRKKLEVERQRLKTGRTTTFQILAFEQEYQESKQSLIKTQGHLWQLSGEIAFYLNEI